MKQSGRWTGGDPPIGYNLRGIKRGSNFISLTALHHILANPAYIGELTSRGERCPGLHQAIIDPALWKQAQAVLAERRLFKPRQPEHVLAVLVWDA